jgi:hypothetical protein
VSECTDSSCTLPNTRPDVEARLMSRKKMNIARTARNSSNTFLFLLKKAPIFVRLERLVKALK